MYEEPRVTMAECPVAGPGDEDLEVDVTGLVLVGLSGMGRDWLLTLTGGQGCWVMDDQRHDDLTNVEMTMTISLLGDHEAQFLEWMEARLQRWARERTPLRLCSAGDARPATLSEVGDPDRWLPLPTRQWQGEDDG